MTRESLHKSIVVAVLLCGNFAFLILDCAEFREKSLEGSIHIDLAFVGLVLKVMGADV